MVFIQLHTELNLAAWEAWRVKHHPHPRCSGSFGPNPEFPVVAQLEGRAEAL